MTRHATDKSEPRFQDLESYREYCVYGDSELTRDIMFLVEKGKNETPTMYVKYFETPRLDVDEYHVYDDGASNGCGYAVVEVTGKMSPKPHYFCMDERCIEDNCVHIDALKARFNMED